MDRIKLTIEYDGTNFCGYQVQPNKRTVQSELEKALYSIYNMDVITYSSGRTDAGVHALGAVVHYDEPKEIKNKRVADSINAFLPDDVKVIKAERVGEEFDARFSAKRKTYAYKFYLSRTERPLQNNRALRVNEEVMVDKMKEACKHLIGEFDFTSFVARKSGKTNFVREIYSADIVKTADKEFEFRITGNGFLYNMVRIIMGTLIEIGKGHIEPKDMKSIIDAKNRARAGKTMPPYALYLLEVEY
ncbi:MAG: tRNA pseudouridine(38-40) synthase TruA [Clostridia bacterium]|nr:tRNA pseudouridine(38-40) synthase TruA [Clostridia bacterium]